MATKEIALGNDNKADFKNLSILSEKCYDFMQNIMKLQADGQVGCSLSFKHGECTC